MSDEFHGVAAELGDAGPCPTISYLGKTWSVGWPTQRAKAELEFLVVKAAKRNLELLRPVLGENEYRAEEKELKLALQGGHWKTWGPLWNAVNGGPDTNTFFLLSLLRERHPEATFEDAEGMWLTATDAVREAFMLVVPSFYTLLVKCLPGTPEERAETLAESVSQLRRLLNFPSPESASDSSEATTSSGSNPG
jgi:hypothetical protein